MDDPGGVCVSQSEADLIDHLDRSIVLERSFFAQHAREVTPLGELHHYEVAAILFSRIEDIGDVGVTQSCRGSGLPPEALYEAGVLGKVRGQDLDRHVTSELLIEGPIDGAHPSTSDLLLDAVSILEEAVNAYH